MKLGLSSYTYGWAVGVPGHPPKTPLDEHGLLDKALAHGISVLQIGDNLPLHSFDSGRLARLAARAQQAKVQLEVGARRLTRERIEAYAGIARRLQATLLRFVIDDANCEPEPEAVITTLRESLPLFDGLTLGIENHDRFSVETLKSIIEAVASDHVGICLDTANSLGAGEGLEVVVDKLAPYAVNLHIKDFLIERFPHKMGFTVTGRPAGSGCLDAPALVTRLAPFGRCQTATLELWTPPENNLEVTISKEASWAVQSINYLKSIGLA